MKQTKSLEKRKLAFSGEERSMTPKENRGPKRGLYRRSTDDDIYFYLGKFSFLTAEELAHLSTRNPVSLRKRLRQLVIAGVIGRESSAIQRQEFFEEIACVKCGTVNKLARQDGKIRPNPFFHFLMLKGGEKAAPLIENPIAFRSKAQSRIDHDRVVTTIHLSFDRAFGDDLSSWRQQKDDLKISVNMPDGLVNFYPDGFVRLNGRPLYIEYANSEPSSKFGVTDIVEKVDRYNEFIRANRRNEGIEAKVLFIFRERSMVENFVNRLADEFPYLWIYATDIESIKHNPKGKIFWTPRDFAERAHGLID